MFTASSFSLIRQNCPEALNELLRLLEIDKPNWVRGDEFEISQKLDGEIEEKICILLKSDSDLAGYAKLLDMGGVNFSISETRKERIEKILANRDKILSASSGCTHDLYNIRVTCNRAESFTDKVNSAWYSKSIMPLIEPKEEISLSQIAQQKIKNILAEELTLSYCDEIVISIIGKKSVSPRKVSPILKLDDKTFKILEQLDKIFNKI